MTWSAIIPAAGAGKRLGTVGSKLFYRVAGRALSSYLLPRFTFCENVVIVLSSDPGLKLPNNATLAIQAEPRGMADAVRIGLEHVTTDYVCVAWGDQIVFSAELIPRAKAALENYALDACFPVAAVKNPYTHLVHKDGKVVSVLQRREGDEMPAAGLSDVGLFFFRTAALKEVIQAENVPGKVTGELNFLPLLCKFPNSSFILAQSDDVVGINTPEDVARVEGMLCR